MLFWILGLTITSCISGFFWWLFWFPLRLFFFSLIPVHAAYAWVGKLLIVLLIGFFGGIGVPMFTFVVGIVILCALRKLI